MPIDRASVVAERYKTNPQVLQAAVLGQNPAVDPYTALRALQLIGESNQMQMGAQAQQPTQTPSLVDRVLMQQGSMVGGMPGGMPGGPGQAPGAPGAPAGLAAMVGAPPGPAPDQASQGLAGMPAGQQGFAPGGIVAFAGGGTPDDQDEYNPFADPSMLATMPGANQVPPEVLRALFQQTQQAPQAAGAQPGAPAVDLDDPSSQAYWLRKLAEREGALKRLQERQSPAMTPEEETALQGRLYKQLLEQAGPSPLQEFLTKYGATPEQKQEALQQARGLGLLRAAAAMTKPGRGFMTALGEAGEMFGGTYAAAQQAQQQEELRRARTEAEIRDAMRKEKLGYSKEAAAIMERRRKEAKDAQAAEVQAQRQDIETAAKAATATKAPKPTFMTPGQALVQAETEYQLNPTPEAKKRLDAARSAAQLTQQRVTNVISDVGAGKQALTVAELQRKIDANVQKAMTDWKKDVLSEDVKAYNKALKAGKKDEANRILAAEEARQRAFFSRLPASSLPDVSAPPIKLD